MRAIGVLLLALLGCARSGERVVVDSPYYALAVGNTWIYEGPHGTRTARVVKHEVIDGIACALVETEQGDKVAREHLFVREDGVYGLTADGIKLSQPLPLLKLPATKGRTWRVDFTIGASKSRGVFRIDRAAVTVPYGKFDAVLVQSEKFVGEERTEIQRTWFAAKIGIVKQETQIGEQSVVYELKEFRREKQKAAIAD